MNSKTKSRWTIGKLLISFVAVFTAVGPYLADWNVTHIYNPAWTPHAKFHNAQTMVLGTMLGFLTIYCLWLRKGVTEKQKLNEVTVLASLYWLAQLPATFFPGTALADPGINIAILNHSCSRGGAKSARPPRHWATTGGLPLQKLCK